MQDQTEHPNKAFQVNTRVTRQLAKRKRRIQRRQHQSRQRLDDGRPVLGRSRAIYEVADRVQAVSHGGLGAIHEVVKRTGLIGRIDAAVMVLAFHRPYHESDHVLNIAYNVVCGGRTLQEIDLQRNDEALLDGLGVDMIPDPTTAGDFCRRFEEHHVTALLGAINDTRLEVWARQGPEFFAERACIDADGSVVPTTGECKEGMALSYKGVWGYHPLLVSLANTGEPLFIVNRPANRPSHEGAAGYLDQAIVLCRRGGFKDILLRGDTDFSQTQHLDRWNADGVCFVFGYDASKGMKGRADGVQASDYHELERRAKRAFVEEDQERSRPERVKGKFVRSHGYKNIILKSEDIAEFAYRPGACETTYRMVVLRKNLSIERGETALFDEVRYFFYITNDPTMSAADVVFASNDRCNQENLIEQLKNGARALHAPVNTLNANWAYMVMAALAWTLKAWTALWLPVDARWRKKHEAERRSWLRMDFRTFRKAVIDVPAQILVSGRQRIWRLLAWRPQLPILFRLLATL